MSDGTHQGHPIMHQRATHHPLSCRADSPQMSQGESTYIHFEEQAAEGWLGYPTHQQKP